MPRSLAAPWRIPSGLARLRATASAFRGVVVTVGLVLHAEVARGEDTRRCVVVIGDPSRDGPLLAQLRAELAGGGFTPVGRVRDVETREMFDALAAAVRAEGCPGAIAVDRRAGILRIGAGPATTWATKRSLVLPADGTPERDRVVALQAVETLRIALATLPTPRASSLPAADLAAPRATESSPRLWTLGVSPAAALGPGALLPGFQVRVDTWWTPGRSPIGPALDLWFPVLPAQLRAAEGDATTWIGACLLGPRLRLVAPHRRVTADLGLAGGLTWAVIHGRGVPPHRGIDVRGVTGLVAGRVGVGVVVAPRWVLRMDVLAGLAAPELRVAFAGRPVATWGRGVFLLGIGVDFALLGSRGPEARASRFPPARARAGFSVARTSGRVGV